MLRSVHLQAQPLLTEKEESPREQSPRDRYKHPGEQLDMEFHQRTGTEA